MATTTNVEVTDVNAVIDKSHNLLSSPKAEPKKLCG